MKRLLSLLGALVAALLAFALPANADQSQVMAQASPTPGPSDSASPSPSPSPTPAPFQVSGFVDVGYQSASFASAGGVIPGRVFDTAQSSGQLHNLNLQLSYTGTIGGKVEFSIGDDASYIHSYPLSTVLAPLPVAAGPSFGSIAAGIASRVDPTQIYASYSTGKLTLIGGKYETLAGAEVIEATGNTNYSRSILFGYAIPFTHTGVRATWAASGALSGILGVNKGWDTDGTLSRNGDNNALTLEYGVSWNPVKQFSITLQGYTGNIEQGYFVPGPTAGSLVVGPQQSRSLVDSVLTYHYNDNVAVILNPDFGSQTNTTLVNGSGFVTGTGTANWSGVAGYITDQFTPKLLGSLRAEYLNDANGFRTGFAQNWSEITLTGTYAWTNNLSTRLEFRGDSSSVPMFGNTSGALYKTNTQFGIEGIYKFP